MPRIFDNIEQSLVDALLETLHLADRADFCVGYFNLRGWRALDEPIQRWAGGAGQCCRLLVGMHRLPQEDVRALFHLGTGTDDIDVSTANRRKKQIVEDFRNQLTIGVPTSADEAGLRRLAAQVKAGKVVVKLFLAHALHAKLYLLFRPDPVNPAIGFVGSSNLTLAGLSRQGELNVDVLDHDACAKLARWFEDRWNDDYCLDISADLVRVIEESWARETPVLPYHIYIKMAYHIAEEARTGVKEFRIPADFNNLLFEFQAKAVQIAAHHLNKRGGVLIGDVVGLGKTLMATALARIFEDDHGLETLILCPKNLVPMWEDYRSRYRMRARVVPLSMARKTLAGDFPRFRLVLLDESHNLRNREGRTYRAVRDYIERNESKCIFLSATPYNKDYVDLSNQLRLFVPEDYDLGVRPEQHLRALGGELEFQQRYQCGVRTLAGFEKSPYADDWRELMRLYLVRRTRGFIKQHYARTDRATGGKYLVTADGRRLPFPERIPRTVPVRMERGGEGDQYARLFDPAVEDTIDRLHLPRYGLGNYIPPSPEQPPTPAETNVLRDLSRAGNRLIGFCRTNLFKRLESNGHSFLLSLERHVLRNFVFLHALGNNLPLPLGTQDAELLDPGFSDADEPLWDEEADDEEASDPAAASSVLRTEADFARRAAEVYQAYAGPLKHRFKWLRPSLFAPALADHLREDARALWRILEAAGPWDAARDVKLQALVRLVTETHPSEKVLVFTQFADTVRYLEDEMLDREIDAVAGVTGQSDNPTALARRFSPVSNGAAGKVAPAQELRVLIATDVLSEGQNLQDAAIVVNFDLPWAIIRLTQRAGRVDRIGQQAERILCYSFLPADGVERILRLRARVRRRLRENAEVVGTDEAFFEDDPAQRVHDLYHEMAGLLDDDGDAEIDLASRAFQVWSDAIAADPRLKNVIEEMPNVVYATKPHTATAQAPEGALVYLRTAQDNDALAWIDQDGKSVTESMAAILDAAACAPDTPALPRLPQHHELVRKALEVAALEEKQVGGQLGKPSSARRRAYDRLRAYADTARGTLFASAELERTIEELYRFPLTESARDTLNRQLKVALPDQDLAELVMALRRDGRLCQVTDETTHREPRIICSLGLAAGG